MGGQQYVKGMVSVTSTPMVSTTARHPEGYTQDEGNPQVWWGAVVCRDNYQIQPAWTAAEGYTVQVDVYDCIPVGELGQFIADLEGIGQEIGHG